MTKNYRYYFAMLCATSFILLTGCSSMKTPATAEVAVSNAAVENAARDGAMEFAPIEMTAAREKMERANKAMTDKDYVLAEELAEQAQSDAKLAQGKANSAKATMAAEALQEDIRVLREEMNRARR